MVEISILIPTYNRAPLLDRCLRSVLSWPRANIEVLVSDNASSDSTSQVLTGFHDTRLRHWRNDTNLGCVRNLFLVAGQARGKWLFFLTDDDYLLPDALERLGHIIQAHPDAGVIITPLQNITEDGKALDVYKFHTESARFAAGMEALSHMIWAAHILSRLVIRREWVDLKETPLLDECMYPQMYWVGVVVRDHAGVYQDEPMVAHTVGNKNYWDYTGDFMVKSRIQMFKVMLPGEPWKKERAFLNDQLIKQIAAHHFPHTWKRSFSSWLKHNWLLLSIPEVLGSSIYWSGLFGFLKKKIFK
jgi:glycosyltransferase involved in cell wall biosynthesis